MKLVVCPQVEFNKTTSALEFTKEMARTMGERSGRDRESLLMICHDVDPVRQLALHVLMRPSYSLLDVCGPIPTDYLDGELILPLYIPNNKVFVCLVAHQHASCKTYSPELYLGEIGKHPERRTNSLQVGGLNSSAGFFQGILRSTQAYDEAGKDMITGEYARSTHAFHGCSPEILKSGLLGTIDLLWAANQPLKEAPAFLDLLLARPADSEPPAEEPNLIELLLASAGSLGASG